MSTRVSFGALTTNSIRKNTTDIIGLYKKNVEKMKQQENKDVNAVSEQNVNLSSKEIEENIEKAKNEVHRFGELTGINEDYYRPLEKVISTIEYAKDNSEETSNMPLFNITSEMEEIRKSVEEAQHEADNQN